MGEKGLFFLFDERNILIDRKMVGIRVKGNASRGAAQKSFNLYARKEYEGGEFNAFRTGEHGKKITLLMT